MIGYLHGRVIECQPETVLVDVQGVGYELQISTLTSSEFSGRVEVKVWVQTFVRDDAIVLFGFATMLEKRLFLSLIKVNGVGPKMALKILSGGPLHHIVEMIDRSDVKGLSALPKVGKKTAEQLILSLKGKLVAEESLSENRSQRAPEPHEDIVSALVNLGFRLQDVEKVVEQFPEQIDVQQGIRQGLQALSSAV